MNNFILNKNFVIGVIHLLPLPGYKGNQPKEVILENALIDLKALEEGGVDAIMVENNYDLPHRINVGPETVSAMTFLVNEIRKETKLPLGISVLWNDYRAALSIAKTCGGSFIRIPVFVDKVETSYGIVQGKPKSVNDYKKRINANDIKIFADIHVKHSKLLSEKSILVSAKEAIKKGAYAVIVTGKWTSNAPSINKLKSIRKVIPNDPIIIGSGANKNNISSLMSVADGVIVSTSLKRGLQKKGEVNVKSDNQRIDKNKVMKFVKSLNNQRH